MKITISATKQEESIVEHLRAKRTELESEVRKLRNIVGQQQEFARAVNQAVKATDPFPKVEYKVPSRAERPVIPVLKFSDWHVGEVISKEETEGFGTYNWKKAQDRAFRITQGFLSWVETQRHGYRIDECVVFCEGDYISGDIHRELSVTNEFPVPVQTARAGLLLGHCFSLLAPHFKKITIYEEGADNHGRLNPKPQFKQKTSNSFSYLVHTIANSVIEKHENIVTKIAEGIKLLAEVNGFRFLIEHGDTTKAWMGIPYYGIERSRAREATRRMNSDLGFHYQSIGHWHVPGIVSGNVIVNGSLSGTTEFDHGCGRHAPPSQVAFLVHPKYGVFNFVPFRGR